MKTLFRIILLISFSQSAFGNTDVPVFIVTSNCVQSIEVKDSNIGLGWTLIVNLDDDAAKSLLTFSNEHLKEQARITDGAGNRVIKNDVRIQTSISTPFLVSGLNSQKEAQDAKKRILSTKGKCGVK